MNKIFDINQIDFNKMYELHQTLHPHFCYHQLYNKIPDRHRFFEVNKRKIIDDLGKEFDLNEGKIVLTTLNFSDAELNSPGISLYVIAPLIMVTFVPKEFGESNEVQILCHDDADAKTLEKVFTICNTNYITDELINEPNVRILSNGDYDDVHFVPFKINQVELNLSLHYNDYFLPIHELIISRLEKENDKGLVILYGKPGSGKTSYIRTLAGNLKKKILFVPSSLAHLIASPAFMHLLENNANSILVIEDAENILQKRGAKDNDVVSIILNLTDGLLTDCYKIQVLCTFNTELANIDKALLRKGRLITKYEFNELSLAKSKLLAKELGINLEITQPMLLTDLFNFEEETHTENKLVMGYKKLMFS